MSGDGMKAYQEETARLRDATFTKRYKSAEYVHDHKTLWSILVEDAERTCGCSERWTDGKRASSNLQGQYLLLERALIRAVRTIAADSSQASDDIMRAIIREATE
ncbi:MAG: hypothetical protein M0R37_10485 [Bacteroidales bacterium]|jgi:hypothetical protein|nr:hypothetical protein [Bacteroidales bacterium]